MRMKKRSIALLIVAIVLVSIYWNFNPTYSKTHPRTNASNEEKETSLKADEQQLSHHKEHVALRYTTTTIITNATPKAQTFARTSNPRTQDSNFKLQQRILQLEKMLNQSQLRRKVIFIGPSSTLKKEIPLYKPSLLKHGYVIETILERKKIDDVLNEWSGLMCYGIPGKKSCLNKGELAKVEVHQKISYIPGLVQVFSPPHSFCYTMSQTLHISVLSQFPMSVPCHVLPPKSNLNLLKKLLESTDDRSLFLIKSSHGLSMFSKKNTFKESLLRNKGVLQVISHPFLVSGLPVLVKFYVIITSMSPLRIYRHLDGHASVMTLDKGQIKVTWTLENFKEYLNKHYTKHEVDKVWSNVDRTIVNTLMVSESLLGSNDLDSKNNFQLLEFHFTLNSSLHPLLLEVNVPDPGTTLQGVANDTIDLVFTMTSSYSHVTDALEKLKDIIGVKGVNCHDKHSVCLSDQELIYLLESHRENAALGRFKKLYPMHDSRKYQPLLTELKSSSVGMVINQHRGTPQLHGTLVLMENYGNRRTETMPAVQHVDKRKGYWETDDDDMDDSADKGIEDNQEFPNHLDDCDDDPSIVPVLTDILIEPEAKLKPSFTSEILEYEIVFPFDVMTVNVWGKTSTCRSQARVNSKAKTTKEPINYSLGVGWNKFVIHLINLYPRSYAVLASYNIHIYRRTRSEKAFDPRSPHEMCAFKQDCDLKTFPEMPCGPQPLPLKSFQEFKLSRKGLPHCDNGHARGSWVLPCVNCNQPRSCYWNEAMWTPQSCQHKLLTTKQAKTCLAKKKILFVGDSTNRGMMYYLMEKINGSLHQWEKTHSMKVYSSALNDDQTSVSFAYYPQFWLPSDRKPVFLKALHHLMAKFMPLHNSTDTILVVGGVQWLLPSHVTAVKSTIDSLGLGGIKVLVKSLGSGFHLPVPGFVQLNLEGQKKVSRRNQLLIKKAKNVGFEVIDTHTMTVSRYKEFVMGKCGCHFHKVVDMRSHKKELNDDSTVIDDVNNGLPRYHVIGSINKAYADIMISRMCS